MRLTRKEFIKTASLASGGLFFGFGNAIPLNLKSQAAGFRELRDGVGIFTQKGGTIGWYVSGDQAAVVDSQFPDSAEIFLKGLKERNAGKIKVLFNTHHHRDHTSGNFFLKNFSEKIVAQENCPRLQLKQNKGTENGKNQVYADTTFKTSYEEEVGDETISAQFIGAAHTGGDSLIHFQEANIVHLGDLVFNECYPRIDQEGEGSIGGWIEVLERAVKRFDGDTIFIYGHAASEELVTGKKADLIKMRDYLSTLMDYVKQEAASGKSVDDIKKAEFIPLNKKRKALWDGAVAANIEAAYNELNNTKNKK